MTEVFPMAQITSDHVPCRVSVNTRIPKANVFRFESFWVQHDGFIDTVQDSWMAPTHNLNSSRVISTKFKRLRQPLKLWSKNLSNLNLLISNCNIVTLFLDGLENARILFNPEANLRIMVKKQRKTLLHYKNLYWRKRFTNNKVKFGDECTKFFHAMATISHRQNTISQILNEDGIWVQDHSGKEALLWSTFKNRLGVSTGVTMLFNLDILVTPRDNLDTLGGPIYREQIDSLVKRLPSDKAPGPDGFNGLFIKKCWDIIKNDFYSSVRTSLRETQAWRALTIPLLY
jgi:hypothetical protein